MAAAPGSHSRDLATVGLLAKSRTAFIDAFGSHGKRLGAHCHSVTFVLSDKTRSKVLVGDTAGLHPSLQHLLTTPRSGHAGVTSGPLLLPASASSSTVICCKHEIWAWRLLRPLWAGEMNRHSPRELPPSHWQLQTAACLMSLIVRIVGSRIREIILVEGWSTKASGRAGRRRAHR